MAEKNTSMAPESRSSLLEVSWEDVSEPGAYALCFDNTFSLVSSKTVFTCVAAVGDDGHRRRRFARAHILAYK